MRCGDCGGEYYQEYHGRWGCEFESELYESPTTNCKASGIRDQIEAGVLQRGVKFDDSDKKDPRWMVLQWIHFKDQM